MDPTSLLNRPTAAAVLAPPAPQLALAASLLGVQSMLFLITAIEAALLASVFGNAVSTPALGSAAFAVVLLVTQARVRRGQGRPARLLEWMLLIWAGLDLGLALFLAGSGLGLTASITRIGLPVAVLILVPRSPRRRRVS